MVCRVETVEGVVHHYAAKGIILLDEADYLEVRKQGGYLGVSSSTKHTVLRAFALFYPTQEGKRIPKSEPVGREWLHRFILKAPPRLVVDHINNNPLDNRRCNIRLCTQSENKQNSQVARTSKTGFKGVTVCGDSFKASITLRGKNRILGYFPGADLAAKVYDLAAVDFFGEFAKTNFDREAIEAWRPEWEKIKGLFG